MANRHLILGGARSGKTRYALDLARTHAAAAIRRVTYVATAQPLDAEMHARIERHRTERPADWDTVEAPVDLAARLRPIARDRILVVDCLTLWCSNVVIADFDEEKPTAPLPAWEREREALLEFLRTFEGTTLLVSNEVGGGIVPAVPLARRFRDEQGRLNQSLAALCDQVSLVVAGLALKIK